MSTDQADNAFLGRPEPAADLLELRVVSPVSARTLESVHYRRQQTI
ncbi:hypothetical protein HUT16_04020 [Kitasatospora sp. NA04385]|nr:hypothetical protein [Kitasatospora sp. NA04385]QKW18341.1 hypothetical protein HUT16_04020 [Kitasatospora sp. NA04385]